MEKEEYKDEHVGKEGMIEVERRNGGLGTDSSEGGSRKEEFVLQDLGVEESEDRRIGDEIEHGGGFGGIEALSRKCIMGRRDIFPFERSTEHCQVPHRQLPWCEIHHHYHHHR